MEEDVSGVLAATAEAGAGEEGEAADHGRFGDADAVADVVDEHRAAAEQIPLGAGARELEELVAARENGAVGRAGDDGLAADLVGEGEFVGDAVEVAEKEGEVPVAAVLGEGVDAG